MNLKFRDYKWLYALVSGLMVLFGLIFLFLPSKSVGAFAVLMCICVFIVGASKIAFHFIVQKDVELIGWDLLDGVMELLLALLIMFSGAASMLVVGTMVGMWAVLVSAQAVSISIALRCRGEKTWIVRLALACLASLFAILMLFIPYSTAVIATTTVGLFLIVRGLNQFISIATS